MTETELWENGPLCATCLLRFVKGELSYRLSDGTHRPARSVDEVHAMIYGERELHDIFGRQAGWRAATMFKGTAVCEWHLQDAR